MPSDSEDAQPAVLIATLGSEPQVVTAAFDLLQARYLSLRQVIVLHTTAPGAVAAAVETLRRAAPTLPVPLTLLPITDQGQPLIDVETPQASQAALRALYQQLRQAKMQGWQVHLLIAGGRKTLAIFGMVAAQMLFDEEDRLWHLFSSGEFLASRRLHPGPGDEVHLVEIPVIRWSQLSPVFGELAQIDDPFLALERIRGLQIHEKIAHARAFVEGRLSAAERRVVQALVEEGLSDQEIGERLALSPRTVERHLRSSYSKAAEHWGAAAFTRAGLVAVLQLYYSFQIGGKPA